MGDDTVNSYQFPRCCTSIYNLVQFRTQTLWNEGDQEARGVWVRDWLSYQQCDIYVWLQHILVIYR